MQKKKKSLDAVRHTSRVGLWIKKATSHGHSWSSLSTHNTTLTDKSKWTIKWYNWPNCSNSWQKANSLYWEVLIVLNRKMAYWRISRDSHKCTALINWSSSGSFSPPLMAVPLKVTLIHAIDLIAALCWQTDADDDGKRDDGHSWWQGLRGRLSRRITNNSGTFRRVASILSSCLRGMYRN